MILRLVQSVPRSKPPNVTTLRLHERQVAHRPAGTAGTAGQHEKVQLQKFQASVEFSCPKCREAARTEIDVPEPDWSCVERSSDVAGDGQTSIRCTHCLTLFEATVEFDSAQTRVTLDDYPDTRVIADTAFFSPPEEGDWESLDVPLSPYDHFTEAYHHLGHLLAQVNDQGGDIHIPMTSREVLNRMVFTQQIGALEAYLGDTLKNGVLGSAASMLLMLESDLELKKTSIPLTEIAKSPSIVNDTVGKYLSGLIYHNLAKVDKLYQIAFGVSIWPNKDVAKKLFVAVTQRHDCIHRNGKDKNGNAFKGITREYVSEILKTTLAMVVHIEGGLGRDRTQDWKVAGAEKALF